jgi:hypothetical protein
MPDLEGIAYIARRLGLDAGTVRRFIARESEALGVVLHRGKGDRLLLTRDDADKVIASYEARRGPVNPDDQASATLDRYGWFYVIQLVPEALPDRVKIGFADNVDKRLAEHRTAAPTARLLKAWPCKRSWDYAATDSVTRDGCKLVLNEVYEGEPRGFLDRGDQFFSVMPSPESEKDLSEHSPLYEADEASGRADLRKPEKE